MCFSFIIWLMVIDCLSVFLSSFDYLFFAQGTSLVDKLLKPRKPEARRE